MLRSFAAPSARRPALQSEIPTMHEHYHLISSVT